jgi:hypothetical protein
MKRFRSARVAADLSASVHHQLNMYVLAASAAGVGMLALAQAANAKIIYTPAHHVIRKNGHLNIDLNHDGAPDFTVFNSQFFSKSRGVNLIQATPDEDSAAVINNRYQDVFLVICGPEARGTCWL